MHKYGREFSAAVMENRDGCVPERVSSIFTVSSLVTRIHCDTAFVAHRVAQVVKKLELFMPSAELVDSYLHEIAKAYAVEWAPPVRDKPGDDDDDDDEGGVKVCLSSPYP